jgi:hypothetical protein
MYGNSICDIELKRWCFYRPGRWKAFCSSILSLWNFWIKALACSKGTQVTLLSRSCSSSLLLQKAWVPLSYVTVYLFCILHDMISLQVYNWRWSSIWVWQCLSVCVRAKTGAHWAGCHILYETVELQFPEAFKFWFRSEKSHWYFICPAFEHTLLTELTEFKHT